MYYLPIGYEKLFNLIQIREIEIRRFSLALIHLITHQNPNIKGGKE